MSSQISLPFQSYNILSNLTWEQCFSFTKIDIRDRFAEPLQNAPNIRSQHSWSLRARANMLLHMLSRLDHESESVVIRKEIQDAIQSQHSPSTPKNRVIEVQLLQTINPSVTSGGRLGFVEWDPLYLGRQSLQCYTVFDLLASCMSEAASSTGVSQSPTTYFERLLSLFAHWCRTIRPNQDYRPYTVSVANIKDTILLGATIPGVPDLPTAKEDIRKTRQIILGTRHLHEKKNLHENLICKEAKSMEGGQLYGNCAETSFFNMLCAVDKENRLQAQGLAMVIPNQAFSSHENDGERLLAMCGKGLHLSMCANCHRMAKLCIEDDAGRNGKTVRYITPDRCWWSSNMRYLNM